MDNEDDNVILRCDKEGVVYTLHIAYYIAHWATLDSQFVLGSQHTI